MTERKKVLIGILVLIVWMMGISTAEQWRACGANRVQAVVNTVIDGKPDFMQCVSTEGKNN